MNYGAPWNGAMQLKWLKSSTSVEVLLNARKVVEEVPPSMISIKSGCRHDSLSTFAG